jgi:hypothetical protein
MSAHLFVVNNDTFPIHIQRNFAGVVKGGGIGYYGQLADLMNIREGDLAFFYLMYSNKNNLLWPENNFESGYYGIYKIKSKPFFDERDVEGKDQFEEQLIFGNPNSETYKKAKEQEKRPLVLPLRMLIEPMENLNYAAHVDDTTAYVDKTDEGQLWTLLFKKINKAGQARGITPLLPEEASKIARLLFKANQIKLSDKINLLSDIKSHGYPYKPEKFITTDLEPAPNNPESVRIENMLVAWIMEHLDEDVPVLSDLIGKREDLEFRGNHIQYGIAGDTVDILLLHRRKINGIEYRYKATVIEAKKDKINEGNVDQALRYTKWIAQLVTFNNISAIQPVVIGKKPNTRQIEKIKAKIKNLNERGIRTPIFLEYKLHGTKTISFEKFEV